MYISVICKVKLYHFDTGIVIIYPYCEYLFSLTEYIITFAKIVVKLLFRNFVVIL